MKYVHLNLTPANFPGGLEKARAHLAKAGDIEVTLALRGGEYALPSLISWDASAWTGKKQLRVLGSGGRIRTTLSALRDLPTEGFAPVDGKPYYVCQLDKQADGLYPNLRTLYADGHIAPISRTAAHRTAPAFEGYAPRQENFASEYHQRLYIPLEAARSSTSAWNGNTRSTTSTTWTSTTAPSRAGRPTWRFRFGRMR